MAHILVTGAAGFIGSHLVDTLTRHGYEVRGIDDLSTGQKTNVNSDSTFLQKSVQELKLSDLDCIDIVVHLAAIPRTQYCIEYPELTHNANVTGTLHLLNLVRQQPIQKFVLISSCAVYGQQPGEKALTENDPINLGTTYAVQKYMQELYTKNHTTLHTIPSVILRLFNVYGSARQSEKGAYPNVLAAFSKQKQEMGRVFVTGDGEQTRDMVHVFDVVNAIEKAMFSPFQDARVFNIGTGIQTSVNQMASHFHCPIEYIESRPGEARHFFADIHRAKTELYWKPEITFQKGIEYLWTKF